MYRLPFPRLPTPRVIGGTPLILAGYPQLLAAPSGGLRANGDEALVALTVLLLALVSPLLDYL